MAIDTRSGTPAGGADDQRGADNGPERAPPERAPVGDSGTAETGDRLVSETGAPSAAPPENDLRFEAEALPWMDDVYRFALSLTRDASDADDVVQDLVSLVRGLGVDHDPRRRQVGLEGDSHLVVIAHSMSSQGP